MIEILQEQGAQVIYNDPYIPKISGMRQHKIDMKSTDLTAKLLSKVDCVIIVTAHSKYNYKWIVNNAKLIIDTRNAIGSGLRSKKVIKA